MRLFAKRETDRVRDWMLWRWWDVRPKGRPYMTRLYLLNTPWRGWKVHWFQAPDPDSDCHDHPWWFVSLVLRGGYVEHRQFISGGILLGEIVRYRGRFSIAFRRSRDVHTIRYVQPGTVTFIMNGPKERSWGFWRTAPIGPADQMEFIPWREYLGVPKNQPEV